MKCNCKKSSFSTLADHIIQHRVFSRLTFYFSRDYQGGLNYHILNYILLDIQDVLSYAFNKPTIGLSLSSRRVMRSTHLALTQLPGKKMTTALPLSIDEICRYLGINRDIFYMWIDLKQPQAYYSDALQKLKKTDVND